MSRNKGKSPSPRQRRVSEELRHALVRALGHARFADPELADVSFTVTEVRIGHDMKTATAFVTPLGGADQDNKVAALNRASAYLRGLLGQELRLRHTPSLSFEPDRSFDEASRIEAILHRPRVAADLAPPEPDDPGPDGAEPDDPGPDETGAEEPETEAPQSSETNETGGTGETSTGTRGGA